jgi:hypothetical protein
MNGPFIDGTPDIHSQFIPAASSLRELANLLETFDVAHDLLWIVTISNELKQIGWNSLFVSSSIDNLVGTTIYRDGLLDTQNKTDQLRLVDSLHVAVNYLARSVTFSKSRCGGQDQANPEINKALHQLGEKLQEVACECQRS